MSEDIFRNYYGKNCEKVKAAAPIEIRKMKENFRKKFPKQPCLSFTLMLPLPRTEPWSPETSPTKWIVSQATTKRPIRSVQILSGRSTSIG